jgi:hypothetical protein
MSRGGKLRPMASSERAKGCSRARRLTNRAFNVLDEMGDWVLGRSRD